MRPARADRTDIHMGIPTELPNSRTARSLQAHRNPAPLASTNAFGATLASDMNRLDEYFLRWNHYFDVHLSKLPSDYIKDHVRFGFVSDRMAMKFRHYIGVDLLLWGSDLPHSVSTFPNSKVVLEEYLEGVPEAERRKVLVENACDFFGLDPQKELTPTP